MNNTIISALKDIEVRNNCKILYACESGSRAWGFPSQDSDYDVRFIYVRPITAYLSLTESPDTINYLLPNDLDISGWDIKKALIHFGKSNMCLYEWIGSPIIYFEQPEFRSALKQLIPTYINLNKCYHHYLSIAVKKHDEFFKNNSGSIKKLFYSLRCAIAAQWIIKTQTIPDTSLLKNLGGSGIDQIVLKKILALIQLKSVGNEKDTIVPDRTIIDWLTHTLDDLASHNYDLPSCKNTSNNLLDQFFLKTVNL